MRRLAQRLLAGILCGAGARGGSPGDRQATLASVYRGDGSLVESSSVVEVVRYARQNAIAKRNAGVPDDRHIEFRISIHLGDVVQEHDGDLMGNGVNIAEGIRVARA
ncbi:hypothetical protein X727_12305 [Mesorhizobium sp. L103C119B0]|nr:hypothetical protein X727_12305 [Mesorhizobium sp. L103C119B0]